MFNLGHMHCFLQRRFFKTWVIMRPRSRLRAKIQQSELRERCDILILDCFRSLYKRNEVSKFVSDRIGSHKFGPRLASRIFVAQAEVRRKVGSVSPNLLAIMSSDLLARLISVAEHAGQVDEACKLFRHALSSGCLNLELSLHLAAEIQMRSGVDGALQFIAEQADRCALARGKIAYLREARLSILGPGACPVVPST